MTVSFLLIDAYSRLTIHSMGTVEHNARAGASPAVLPKDAGHGGIEDTTVCIKTASSFFEIELEI